MKETFNLYDEVGATVVILMQVPHQIQHPLDVYRNVMSRTLIDKGIENINVLNAMSVSRELHIQTQHLANQVIIEAQLQNPGVVILDPANVFCENNCSIGNMSASYYFDRDHLSSIGFSKSKKNSRKLITGMNS
jgi:hypothetical protein